MLPTKYQVQKEQNFLKPNWQRVTISGTHDGVKMRLIEWLTKTGERLFETIGIQNLTTMLRDPREKTRKRGIL